MKHKIPLYEVPDNSRIGVKHLNLVTEDGVDIEVLDFKHLDGMYSLCKFGEYTVHLAGWIEVGVL